MVGTTGTGKSALGNSIMGVCQHDAGLEMKRIFLSRASSESVTVKSQIEAGVIHGQKVQVVDTPGFFDTKMAFEQTLDEVAESILMIAPGPHAILLVMRIGRSTDEVVKGVELMKKLFGPDSLKFMIVVFTGLDSLENDDMTIDEYVGSIQEGPIRTLLEDCDMRYIGINNMLKPFSQENEKQITELLAMVRHLVKANGKRCYTSYLLDKAKKIMDDEERRQIEEQRIKKDYEEKMQLKSTIEQQNKLMQLMEQTMQRLEKQRERQIRELKEGMY